MAEEQDNVVVFTEGEEQITLKQIEHLLATIEDEQREAHAVVTEAGYIILQCSRSTTDSRIDHKQQTTEPTEVSMQMVLSLKTAALLYIVLVHLGEYLQRKTPDLLACARTLLDDPSFRFYDLNLDQHVQKGDKGGNEAVSDDICLQ